MFPFTHLYKADAIKHQMYIEEKKFNVMMELEHL